MMEILKKHIFILYGFLFSFGLFYINVLPISFSQLILVLFLSLLVPFRKYFCEYFSHWKLEKLIDRKILLMASMVGLGYVFSFDTYSFIGFLLCLVFLWVPISHTLFFVVGLGFFGIGNIFHFFFDPQIASLHFLFSFIFFCMGIIGVIFEILYKKIDFPKINSLVAENILFWCFHMSILTSIFYESIRFYLLGITTLCIFIYSSLKTLSPHEKKAPLGNQKWKSHIVIFSSMVIIFLPVFDMYIVGENSSRLLFLVFLSFLVTYIIGIKFLYQIKK